MAKYIITGLTKGTYGTGNPINESNLTELGDIYQTSTTSGGGSDIYPIAMSFTAGTLLMDMTGSSDISVSLDGRYSLLGHNHAASDITTGTIDYARLPISSTNVTNWNTAHGWGDHAQAGYVTTDTTYSAGTGLSLVGTTFSADFGTTTGTIAQGNDSRISNGQTAYGWGNHASAGYLTSLPAHNHDTLYDNYERWHVYVDGTYRFPVNTGESVNFIAGTNVTLSETAGAITINSTGTSGGTTYTAGTGLTLSGSEFSNTDMGSSQNIFKRIGNSAGTQQFAASNNNDMVRFEGSGASSVSFNATTNTVTISSTDTNTNTTYANMSLTELNTGTATTARSISAKTLTDWGDGKYAPSSHTHSYDNYNYWRLGGNGSYTNIGSTASVNFVGGGATSVSRSGNTITVSSTDTNTNTWRGIDDVPVNGATTTSISSNWAFDFDASMSSALSGKANTSGTYAIRATSTLKSDVGLGSVDNYGSSTAATANTNALRDGNGYLTAKIFRSEYTVTNSTIGYIMTQVDTASNNYLRPSTPAQVKSALNITASDVGADNYSYWRLGANASYTNIGSAESVNFVASGATSVSRSGNTITISSTDTNTDTNTTYSAGTGLSLSGTTFNVTSPFNSSGTYGSLRAQATTKADVGLSNVSNYSSSSSATANTHALRNASGNLYANAFYEGSLRKYKENIQNFESSGLDLISELDIVTFDKKKEYGGVKNKVGIILDDSPKEFAGETGNEVDLYNTIFIQAKAIQELKGEIEELKKLIHGKTD